MCENDVICQNIIFFYTETVITNVQVAFGPTKQ